MSPWKMISFPLSYFKLENDARRWIDVWPTLLIALAISFPFVLFKGPSFFRPNGLLDKTLTLTSCLTGFYVAALVAAATFQQKNLDRPIRSGKVTYLRKDFQGNVSHEEVSRRELACCIFGYLSFLSLALSLLCAYAVSMSSADVKLYRSFFSSSAFEWSRNILIFIFSCMIAHLLVVTNFGLYYLMSRLWRRDPEIVSARPSEIDEEEAA